MDQQAKKHLQEEFDAALEEKDQMITVLQTQVKPHTSQSLHVLSMIKVRNMFGTLAYRNCARLQLATYSMSQSCILSYLQMSPRPKE